MSHGCLLFIGVDYLSTSCHRLSGPVSLVDGVDFCLGYLRDVQRSIDGISTVYRLVIHGWFCGVFPIVFLWIWVY
jgi:hypothetical protein